MAEWEFKPIEEWRERNPGADRPCFQDAKRIVREILADEDLSEIQSGGEAIGRSWPMIREKFGQGRAAEATRNWIAASEKDFDYWRALHIVAADLLRKREPLPDALADWLADALEGNRTTPKQKPGRSWYANASRDMWIAYSVGILSFLGMSPTRNDASSHESACDAIGEVVSRRMNQSLSYAAVVSIWRKQRGTVTHVPAPWEAWDQQLHGFKRETRVV